MPRLVFDIETVGEDWEKIDETSKHMLTRWIEKEHGEGEEYEAALEEIRGGLGLSPLTGEIVAIGVLDVDKNQGAVYYQAPGETPSEVKEGNVVLKSMSEKEMLEAFWKGAEKYLEFISYNGRCFDVPYLMIRSAIHGIRPTRNLMEGRYAYQQRSCRHVDLQDELTFYGATQKKGGLHMYSRAFGITSPKAGGTSGDDVGRLFKEKKFIDIAKYNIGDLVATKELYEKWEKYVKF
jgi:DNA polymerase elongation subunit (family B)